MHRGVLISACHLRMDREWAGCQGVDPQTRQRPGPTSATSPRREGSRYGALMDGSPMPGKSGAGVSLLCG